MIKLTVSFIVLVTFFSLARLKAQPKIIVSIDTSYAHTGKVEFPLSDFGDEITDFYGVFPDVSNISNLTICGKIGTSDPNIKKIGLVQLTPDGDFDQSFGDAGKTIRNWGTSDYPNAMFVTSDSNSFIFLAGASGQSGADMIPALYKFKKNGMPDLSFGGDGHIAVRYDPDSRGEFSMVTSVSTKFLAAGRSEANAPNGHDGFCAMRFQADGTIDSSYGINGKGLIPAKVRSVFAFLTKNASVTFVGASDSLNASIVILGRLTQSGLPDTSFGTNGLINTGISFSTLAGNGLVAGIQPDYKVMAALPPKGISGSMPVSLLRFTAEGKIDSSYGTNGLASIAFSAGHSIAHGINIAKNAKTVIAGSAAGTLEQCATSRNNIDGTPDLTLNQSGTAVIDVDSGAYSNYLIRFVGIGNKRYIGVGASIHHGLSQFLIAHFKDDTLSTNTVLHENTGSNVLIRPNPASTMFTITTDLVANGKIKVVDALGREMTECKEAVRTSDRNEYAIDISMLPNGVYYCIAQFGSEKSVSKVLIHH